MEFMSDVVMEKWHDVIHDSESLCKCRLEDKTMVGEEIKKL